MHKKVQETVMMMSKGALFAAMFLLTVIRSSAIELKTAEEWVIVPLGQEEFRSDTLFTKIEDFDWYKYENVVGYNKVEDVNILKGVLAGGEDAIVEINEAANRAEKELEEKTVSDEAFRLKACLALAKKVGVDPCACIVNDIFGLTDGVIIYESKNILIEGVEYILNRGVCDKRTLKGSDNLRARYSLSSNRIGVVIHLLFNKSNAEYCYIFGSIYDEKKVIDIARVIFMEY